MSKFKQTHFNNLWLMNKEFSAWLRPVKADRYAAYCEFCHTTFSLSNMGKTAVTSHKKGKKHKTSEASRARSENIQSFCVKSTTQSSTMPAQPSSTVQPLMSTFQPSPSTSAEPSIFPVQAFPGDGTLLPVIDDITKDPSKKSNLKSFILNDQVLSAEILWCIDSVIQHRSMRSSARSADLFKKMFHDSDIAKKLHLQRTKIGYLIVYGIAPFFQNELLKSVRQCSHIVVGFDESLNKVSQKGQMDILFRFCDEVNNTVSSRYFDSTFLGHATSSDLLNAFLLALKGIELKKIIQISMDGPNVNLKFLRLLKEHLSEEESSPIILDIGSCGLHTLNNAFRSGIDKTGWNLIQFLRALFNLFRHLPARRADYVHYGGSTKFPLKFCSVRWLENSNVANTAAAILPNVAKYIEGVKKDNKEPKCNSFFIVKTAMADKMLKPKLSFFQSLASELEPFLRAFQSDAPLVPFLYDSIIMTLRTIMHRFVRKEILDNAKNLAKIDVTKSENLKSYKEIDLGYGTREALRDSQPLKDIDVMAFRKECRQALVAVCNKIQENSPIKFKLTKGFSFLNPQVTLEPALRDARISIVLQAFVENRWLKGIEADQYHRQFTEICNNIVTINLLKTFNKSKDRLDTLWLKEIKQSTDNFSSGLERFKKMIFILSHGYAALERGFSVNKECLIENLGDESLVAQRQIYDYISNAGGIESLEISKSMLQYSKNARSRYSEALEKKKNEKTEKANEIRRKREATEKMKELTEKKMKILEEAQQSVTLIEKQLAELKK